MKHGKLQWHPAFGAALRITLRDEMDHLEMHEEYLLGRKPLQMDILLIKNPKNIPVRKSIGQIFREHNIIEYKSPDDYLSINDFYKVYGYACLYQSDTDWMMQIDPGELTITFACSHFPREMLRHLQKSRGITAEDKGNGIFHLKGGRRPDAASAHTKAVGRGKLLAEPSQDRLESRTRNPQTARKLRETQRLQGLCRRDRPHHTRELGRNGGGTQHV